MSLLCCSDTLQRSLNISALCVRLLEPVNILAALDCRFCSQVLSLCNCHKHYHHNQNEVAQLHCIAW